MQVAAVYSKETYPHPDSPAFSPAYSLVLPNTKSKGRTVPIVTTVAVHVLIVAGLAVSTGMVSTFKPEPPSFYIPLPEPSRPQPIEDTPLTPDAFSKHSALTPPGLPDFEIDNPPPGDSAITKGKEGKGDTLVRDPPQQTTTARVLRSSEPPYPSLSRIKEEEGVVIVRITVTQFGAVGDVQVERSSGFPRLDDAALKAVRDWRFAPAKRGVETIASTVLVPVKFRLTKN